MGETSGVMKISVRYMTHTHTTARSASQNYLSKKEQMKTDYWHSSIVLSNQ